VGGVAIEVSTVSPDWLKSLAVAVEARGAYLLDAPVVGSLPQAEAAQLILLAGGADANALRAIPVAALAEILVALDNSGIAPKRALEIVSGLPVMSPAGNGFAGLMVAGDYAPRFTAALIAKHLRYAVAKRPRTRPRSRCSRRRVASSTSCAPKAFAAKTSAPPSRPIAADPGPVIGRKALSFRTIDAIGVAGGTRNTSLKPGVSFVLAGLRTSRL
jgi:hypothetical protein